MNAANWRYKLYALKLILWNKMLKLWWYRLWVRKNEFHPSLSIDVLAMSVMTREEREEYLEDLSLRRELAHARSL